RAGSRPAPGRRCPAPVPLLLRSADPAEPPNRRHPPTPQEMCWRPWWTSWREQPPLRQRCTVNASHPSLLRRGSGGGRETDRTGRYSHHGPMSANVGPRTNRLFEPLFRGVELRCVDVPPRGSPEALNACVSRTMSAYARPLWSSDLMTRSARGFLVALC